MSLNRIILLFVVILLIFIGYIYYQFQMRGISKGGQPKLPTETVTIDGHSFSTEVASTSPEQQMGLSDRSSLAQNGAMIFTFSHPAYVSFWMKEMKFPLDMVFIYKNKIDFIAHNEPIPPAGDKTPPIIQPATESDTVLEINAGIAKQYDFKPGDTVSTSSSISL